MSLIKLIIEGLLSKRGYKKHFQAKMRFSFYTTEQLMSDNNKATLIIIYYIYTVEPLTVEHL